MKYRIPFIRPSFPDSQTLSRDFKSIKDSNWFSNFGPLEKKFSRVSGEFISTNAYATTVANATLGIQIAVNLLFVKSSTKKEVIMPSFTFAAAPEVLIFAGYKPVLIDIQPDSLQPNYKQAVDYLKNNKTKVAGILISNSFGVGNKDIDKWEAIASDNNLPLVIDSAAGFGSRYSQNEKLGTRGDCEIFSFHATKPFAVGEGGLVVSKDTEIISNLRSLQNFGFEKDRLIHRVGTNAKLQEFSCAIGLRQLEGFSERIIRRQNVLQRYKDGLSGAGFKFQYNDNLSTVPFVSILAKNSQLADAVYSNLHSDEIEARRYYTPLHTQEVIKSKSIIPYNLKATEDIASRILSLPVYDYMEEEEINIVVSSILSAESLYD